MANNQYDWEREYPSLVRVIEKELHAIAETNARINELDKRMEKIESRFAVAQPKRRGRPPKSQRLTRISN